MLKKMFLCPKPILFLAALLVLHYTAASECPEEQRRALMAFKSSLEAESRLSSWGNGDCCDWLGIRCDNVSAGVVGLDLSPSTLGPNLAGTLGPSVFSELRSLTHLDLSCVNFTGSPVPTSIGLLTRLTHLNLSSCSFHGPVSHYIFSNLSELTSLDLSFNPRLILSFPSHWTPPFRLSLILLRSTGLGPAFPNWLRTQSWYSILDISGSGISETIPGWFWTISTQANAVFIDLSNNQIRGRITGDASVMLSPITAVDLSSNRLEGPVPSFLFQTRSLDVSRNNFSSLDLPCRGGGGNLFARGFSIMGFLDASNNQLSGELRDCWSNFVSLSILSLSNNKLSGKIPPSIGSLTAILSLKLSNNSFTGEVPSTLSNCTELLAVDLGGNSLSGTIPAWLGRSSSNLAILVMRSNRFHGTIPPSLCSLPSLQVLDLSDNTVTGAIPDCIGNFTTMQTTRGDAKFASDLGYNTYALAFPNPDLFYLSRRYQEKVLLQWKGKLREFGNILGLVKSIDLSRNRLSGGVPRAITKLSELVSLNLSSNSLGGQIPYGIGGMKSLDSLDLSRNKLVGPIPPSLALINRLSNLNLSNNNLSGEIPRGTQLQTFTEAYAGNPELCGDPLPRHCQETNRQADPPGPQASGDEAFRIGVYISTAIGFVVGFWAICGTLIFNKSFRYAYFGFSARAVDRVSVIMLIQKARFLRKDDEKIQGR